MGGLEREIITYLWAVTSPVTPAEVHQAVAPDLAYTTVMTVLSRLWNKGLLARDPKGRGFAYAPVRSEAEHRAGQIKSMLTSSGNREAVLSSFAESLSAKDAERLRRLLDQLGDGDDA